jgi:hypothetical protein
MQEAEENCVMWSIKIRTFTKYYQGDKTKDGEIGGTYSTHQGMRNTYGNLVRNCDGKKPFLGVRSMREKIIFKCILNTRRCGMNSSGLGKGPVAEISSGVNNILVSSL